MSRASRNQRHKMRIKRTNSLLRRTLKDQTIAYGNTMVTLLVVLAQHGGEVTFTKGTAEQVAWNTQSLGYKVDPGANPNEFVIRLVNSADALPEDTIDEQIEAEVDTNLSADLGTDTEIESTPTAQTIGYIDAGTETLVSLHRTAPFDVPGGAPQAN